MRRQPAFTLIELLVVISVIGILIAIMLPALRSTRIQARRAACASNLKQIGVALGVYLPRNNDRLPYASFLPSTGPFPLQTEEPIFIADVLLDDVGGEPAVFRCPDDEPGGVRPPPNTELSYFESERSSYEYRSSLSGRRISEVAERFRRFNRVVADNMIYVMRDYENFHGTAGTPGARRYLYIDGHVADYEN